MIRRWRPLPALAVLCFLVAGMMLHSGQMAGAAGAPGPVHVGLVGPTPEPEEPAVFSVYNVAIQAGRQPVWDEHVAPITRIRVGEHVQLAIYVRATQAPATFYFEFLWGVRVNGKLVAHHGVHTTTSRSPTEHYWAYWTHVFSQPGTYRFTGSADINGTRRHRSLVFSVYR